MALVRTWRHIDQSRPLATDPFLPVIRVKVEATQRKVKSKSLLRVLSAAGYNEQPSSAAPRAEGCAPGVVREHRRFTDLAERAE